MKYRTKVTVMTNGRTFNPGEILPDNISASDLAFLKAKRFVDPVDAAAVVMEQEEDNGDGGEDTGDGDGFSGFGGSAPVTMKSPDEIRKIRSKKEVAAYAKLIGLDLGEDYDGKSLKDIQEDVINFQDEMESGGED